ncbi:S49 family peptidase [Leptospira dzoumogneensis]|uniref:S49 family peptidase n=1 Tax=Leptospira dzoumogneensis TaxID=2484904 RepID=A0A4Z1AIR0_9LEPT|nr:S49 family peptidase [Leptospira dzoumogneensis]TGM98818.1 S49 family peptidase [Leptospira dzoumogneensis]
MFRILFSVVFLPIRILFQGFRILSWIIRKGDHFYLEIPSSFSFDKKSFFVKLLVSKEEAPFLVDFLLGLKALTKVPGLKKVSFHISNPEYGFGEVWNICKAIQSLNEKGIETSGFCLGGGTKALLLLSQCKYRYSSSASEFFPILPSAEPYFFGGAAKKFGVGVEAYASGAFKSFGETFQRTSFSAPARKNLEALLNDYKELLSAGFKKSSNLDLKVLEEPIISSEKLKKIGFITEFVEEDEFEENYLFENYKKEKETDKPKYKKLSPKGFRLYHKKSNFSFISKSIPIVAVLPVQGNILPDLGREEDFRSRQVSFRYYQEIFKDLKEDPKVAAVILEMNSPGGSALVSELLYREIKKLAEKKPVITYVLNVAASGGYYLSCATQKIHGTPYSIVGSIGAVMMRFELKKLYDKFGVQKERIGFYPHRDILSEYGKLSPKSEQFLRKEVLRSRDLFYSRVIESRKTSFQELEKNYGEGRIFSGETFRKSGFLDSCDSFLDTLQNLKTELKSKKIDVRYLPGTYSWKDLVQDLKPGMQFSKFSLFSKFSAEKKQNPLEVLHLSEIAQELSNI